MRKRSALTAAAMVLLLPEAASAFCPETFMQPYCTPSDMVIYRAMVSATKEYIASQTRSQAPVDHRQVMTLGTANAAKMSKLCQAVFNGCQTAPGPEETVCTPNQIHEMSEANARRNPEETAETNCLKYSP